MKNKNIVFGITGSVACYKAIEVIRAVKKLGMSTEVVLTKEAECFIKPLLFQTISGNKVISHDPFKLPEDWDVLHVSVAERADLLVVIPATANIIGKAANGLCDDMLSCIICATDAPVLFVPAMNEGMYRNKIVQDNISRLKKNGYYFTGPVKGRLSCGKTAIGHIQDIDIILKELARLLREK